MALHVDSSTLLAPPSDDWSVGSSTWLGLLAPAAAATSSDGPDGPADGPDGPDGSCASARVVLDRVLEWGPGPDTLAALEWLDLADLGPYERVSYLAALDAHAAWVESRRHAALIAVAGLDTSHDGDVREEVALVLKMAPNTAQIRIDTARTITRFLPRTADALAGGQFSLAHATVIADGVDRAVAGAGWNPHLADGGTHGDVDLTTALAAGLEAKIFPRALNQTLAELRRAVATALARLRPIDHITATKVATAGRNVRLYAGEHSMATLVAELPAADAQLIWLTLTNTARTDPRDLPFDAKRADALTTWATTWTTHPHPSTTNLSNPTPQSDHNGPAEAGSGDCEWAHDASQLGPPLP